MPEKTVSVIIPSQNRAEKVTKCIESILKSDYSDIEIIVVDNASSDNTADLINQKFGQNEKVALIRSDKNLGAAGGRNRGARNASGDYFLFVDSDNVIDKSMIRNLVEFIEKQAGCGMTGPLMFFKEDPEILWLNFADINMYTSRALYKGTFEKSTGQHGEIIRVGHLPNCMMIRSEDFNKIGGFDERYLIMYEDADIAERVKKMLKKDIFIYSKAVTYHDVPISGEDDDNKTGFKSAKIAYLTARNRIYFMKKNASSFQFILFILIFNPLFFVYYEIKLLTNGDFKKACFYLRGNLTGFFY